ncbi:hypothetical protein JCM8547_006512 [Rhodosporidiobolus lusitaniae]
MENSLCLATSLPPELLRQIFRSLRSPFAVQADPLLPRLALVCKTWLPFVQEELYRGAYLDTTTGWGVGAEAIVSDGSRQFVEMVGKRDALAAHVQTIHIGSLATSTSALTDAVCTLLACCPNVTALEDLRTTFVWKDDEISLLSVLSSTRPLQLRRLKRPFSITHAETELLPLFAALAELEDVVPFPLPPLSEPQPSFHLQRLVFSRHVDIRVAIGQPHLLWLAGNSFSSLTHLSLAFNKASSTPFDLSPLVNLSFLALTTASSMTDNQKDHLEAAFPLMLDTLASAQQLPFLRSFLLDQAWSTVTLNCATMYRALLEALPPSVRDLRLNGTAVESVEGAAPVFDGLGGSMRNLVLSDLHMTRGLEKVAAFEELERKAGEKGVVLLFASGETREQVEQEAWTPQPRPYCSTCYGSDDGEEEDDEPGDASE